MSTEKNRNFRVVVFTVCAFLIGFGVGACASKLPIGSSSGDTVDVLSTEETTTTTEQVTTTTQATTTTTPTTTASLPTPNSGLYPEMVVEPLAYKDIAPDEKIVYITFDDGPCENTENLLNLLDQYDVKVTFFVTAQYLEDDAIVESLKEIHKRGHAIGVHTYSHDYYQIYNSVEDYLNDYKKMDDLILQATGERTHIFRFPGGSNANYSSDIRVDLISEMNSRGLVYYDWNAYDGGCDGYSIDAMIDKSVGESDAHSKSILLMHDTPDKTFILDTLPSIITQLRDEGYTFGTIDGTVRPYQFETEESAKTGVKHSLYDDEPSYVAEEQEDITEATTEEQTEEQTEPTTEAQTEVEDTVQDTTYVESSEDYQGDSVAYTTQEETYYTNDAYFE